MISNTSISIIWKMMNSVGSNNLKNYVSPVKIGSTICNRGSRCKRKSQKTLLTSI